MTLVAKIRSKTLQNEVNQRSEFYQNKLSENERLQWQLEQFNANWVQIIKNVPYYRSLYQQGRLPGRFESWDQYLLDMPISTRNDYILEKSQRTDESKKADYQRTTSGSSGNPLQIPAWKSEDLITRPDQWVGRRWYGIDPEDSCFWLTSNSHLLGSGLKGFIHKNKHTLKNALLGYYFYPAYNISTENIRKMADYFIKQNPDYVIGFSGVLDLFARVNSDRKAEFKKLNIKAIIATAEIFPSEDSQQVIAETFHAPVAMEYGTNETIAIAHTLPTGNFKVFWKNYFIEAAENGHNGLKDIRITSLYPRCFPLIRYDLRDQIELLDKNRESQYGVEYFRKVHGRKGYYVVCENGERIHTSAFSSSLRIFPEVTAYQIINEGTDITLNLVTLSSHLTPTLIEKIKYRLSLIHPELINVHINQVDQVQRNSNGKLPLLIRR